MTNPNDPAFSPASAGAVPDPGLTKREEFAKAAMQSLAVQDLYYGTKEKPHNPWPWVCEEAVKAANQLIAELNKEKPSEK